eukprot:48574-Hanusia_phi.AAC.2
MNGSQDPYYRYTMPCIQVQELVFKFIRETVTCQNCKNPETTCNIEGSKKKYGCLLFSPGFGCGGRTDLDHTDRFVKYMVALAECIMVYLLPIWKILHPPDDANYGHAKSAAGAVGAALSEATALDEAAKKKKKSKNAEDDDEKAEKKKKKKKDKEKDSEEEGDDDEDKKEKKKCVQERLRPFFLICLQEKEEGQGCRRRGFSYRRGRRQEEEEVILPLPFPTSIESLKSAGRKKKEKKKEEEEDDWDNDWGDDTSDAAVAARQAALMGSKSSDPDAITAKMEGLMAKNVCTWRMILQTNRLMCD